MTSDWARIPRSSSSWRNRVRNACGGAPTGSRVSKTRHEGRPRSRKWSARPAWSASPVHPSHPLPALLEGTDDVAGPVLVLDGGKGRQSRGLGAVRRGEQEHPGRRRPQATELHKLAATRQGRDEKPLPSALPHADRSGRDAVDVLGPPGGQRSPVMISSNTRTARARRRAAADPPGSPARARGPLRQARGGGRRPTRVAVEDGVHGSQVVVAEAHGGLALVRQDPGGHVRRGDEPVVGGEERVAPADGDQVAARRGAGDLDRGRS